MQSELPRNQKLKKVVLYTQATDGNGDFEAALKVLPILQQDSRISVKWIVNSQQPSIKDKIKKLQNSNSFPGVDTINVDSKHLLNNFSADTDLVIILPSTSKMVDTLHIDIQERFEKTKILSISEYDCSAIQSHTMGLGKNSLGVLMPEPFRHEAKLPENKGLNGFQIQNNYFFGYCNNTSHATLKPYSMVLESFIKSVITIANNEGSNPIQILSNIPEWIIPSLNKFLAAQGIQKIEYYSSKDANARTQEIQGTAGVTNAKTLKIFNPFPVDSDVFQTLLRHAHPVSLCTGDQSPFENIFSSKCIFYQVMTWKIDLANALKSVVKEVCGVESLYYQLMSTAIDNPESLPEMLKQEWNNDSKNIIEQDANKIAAWIKQNKNFTNLFPKLLNSYLSLIEKNFANLSEGIESIESLKRILWDFKEERVQICQAMKNKLPLIIKTEGDLDDALEILMEKEQFSDPIVIVFEAMKNNLPNIRYGGQLKRLFQLPIEQLSTEQRTQILDTIGTQLGTLMINFSQLEELLQLPMKRLSTEQRTQILNAITPAQLGTIIDRYDLPNLFMLHDDKKLSVAQLTKILDGIEGKLITWFQEDDPIYSTLRDWPLFAERYDKMKAQNMTLSPEMKSSISNPVLQAPSASIFNKATNPESKPNVPAPTHHTTNMKPRSKL